MGSTIVAYRQSLTDAQTNRFRHEPAPVLVDAVAASARGARALELPPSFVVAAGHGEESLDLDFLSTQLNRGRQRKPLIYWAGKRAFDIVAASLALLVAAPVLALIYLMIRCYDGGPSFFVQERVGERLQIFRIYKFRTMYHGVSDRPAAVVDGATGQLRRPSIDEDPRITPIGRFLRRWALDELPQIVNILRGDMSIVGPRPLTKAESFAIPPAGLRRYSVPCGLTGLAQLRDREVVASPSRFDSDLEYVERFGVMLDVGIILRTLLLFRQR